MARAVTIMFRLRFVFPSLLVLTTVVPGCGGPAPSAPPPSISQGPHGGAAHPLPGHVGYVEMVNEPEIDRGSESLTAIVLYVLGPDCEEPLEAPALSGLAIDLEVGRSHRRIDFEPKPKANDPAGAARFVSTPGPYDLSRARGTLTGTLDGETFATEFSGGR